MKSALKLAALAAAGYLLWQKFGAQLSAAAAIAGTTEPAAAPPAGNLLKDQVRARAAQEGRDSFNWYEWTWLYHNIINGNTIELIPAPEAYGVAAPTAPMSLDQFWNVLIAGKAAGIGASLPGLAGLAGLSPAPLWTL